jgi:hypothetical protein
MGKMKILAAALTAVLIPASTAAQSGPFAILHPEDYRHYVIQFAADETQATGIPPEDEWPWIVANVPFFASSNKQFEEMYYFRWYAWKKHLVATPRGFVITEWLPKPEAPGGFYGALPDAAPFHLAEARWLRDARIAADDARLWADPAAGARKYSFAWAASVRSVTLATGDISLGTGLLDALVANYEAWEAGQFDLSQGLFWSIDTRDAMEKSISGDGYRPTLNSYMVGDARAIAAFARAAGKTAFAGEYAAKAAALENRIEERLWNPADRFYEVVSPARDSGIRKQQKFKDNGTALQFSGVRELIGYVPWEYFEPPPEHSVAWKQLFSPQGFAGKYGPATAERRSPRFRFPSDDQCTWNGPSWPYATTQTLLALADLLNGPAQDDVGRQQYYALFSNYVTSQHLTLPSGKVIDWIDEDLDADTDEWIAKDILLSRHKQVGRGNYYNHSGFADPLITGLLGLRPRADGKIVIHPLLPAEAWSYCALDGLPYHGHLLAIVYDRDGRQYRRGRGLMLFVDGKELAHRETLGPLEADLPGGAAKTQ